MRVRSHRRTCCNGRRERRRRARKGGAGRTRECRSPRSAPVTSGPDVPRVAVSAYLRSVARRRPRLTRTPHCLSASSIAERVGSSPAKATGTGAAGRLVISATYRADSALSKSSSKSALVRTDLHHSSSAGRCRLAGFRCRREGNGDFRFGGDAVDSPASDGPPPWSQATRYSRTVRAIGRPRKPVPASNRPKASNCGS